MEAISRYVETEEEIILGIKEAQAELRAGKGLSHEQVICEAKAVIAARRRRAKSGRAKSA